ncbi:MAG TPA: tetratricopeptide repeat protein [Thermoplasmata archaeon]|nr:tetratricopeptide repeat protein [Thermoplasmata archaeon]
MPGTLAPLVDRQEEVARIAEALDAAERGEASLLLLRGEAGCGKTRLAQEAVAEAGRRGFDAGFGTALAESVTPYHPWQEALDGLGLGSVLEERPPPKLLGLYVLTENGSITAKVEREGQVPPATALKAIRAYARGAPRTDVEITGEGPISRVTVAAVRAVMLRGTRLVAAIVEGWEDEAFLSDLRALSRELESSLGGSTLPQGAKKSRPPSAEAVLMRFMETGKYEGIDYAHEDPRLRQARLFDQVLLGLSRRAQVLPLLVAIDDLQWADPSSLALMRYVARNLRDRRALLMGAYRVEEAGLRPHLKEALSKMEEDGLPAGILVSGLPRAEMRRIVEVFLGPHALPGEFLDLLWRETQGYPLFIREVLRGLREEGAIRARGATQRLARAVKRLDIPARVREAIRRRLEKLPKEERRLLDAAAACGTRFTTALIARVAGEEENRVVRGLENLVRVHGLLRTTENGFGFDHPAVQEVAYEASPPEARRAHHREAAEWLELVGGPLEDVAEQYYRAGEARAAPKLRQAADGARARYANAEAIRFYDEAMSLEENPGKRREILEALGLVYRLVGDYGASLSSFKRALALADSSRDRARMSGEIADTQSKMGQNETAMRVCVEALPIVEGQGVAEEAMLLSTIAWVHKERGEHDRALEYHGRSLEIREKNGDQAGIAASLNNIGLVHASRGDYDRALEYYARAVPISEKIRHLRLLGNHLGNIGNVHLERGEYDRALEHFGRSLDICEKIGYLPGVALWQGNLGVVHEERGEYDRALEHYGRSLDICEKIGDRRGVARSLGNIGLVHHYRGEYDRALEHYGRSLDMFQKIGDRQGVARELNDIGSVHLERAEYDRALEYHRRSLDIHEKIGDPGGVTDTLVFLAEANMRRGDLLHAESQCNRAISMATQVMDPVSLSSAKRVCGMIDRHLARWGESAANFEESLRVLAQIGAPFFEGKTHYEFGLMWKDKGESERARAQLSMAAQLFEKIGSKKELERARGALRNAP